MNSVLKLSYTDPNYYTLWDKDGGNVVGSLLVSALDSLPLVQEEVKIKGQATLKVLQLVKLDKPSLNLHDWEAVSVGMYDSVYKCQTCKKQHTVQDDNLDTRLPADECKGLR